MLQFSGSTLLFVCLRLLSHVLSCFTGESRRRLITKYTLFKHNWVTNCCRLSRSPLLFVSLNALPVFRNIVAICVRWSEGKIGSSFTIKAKQARGCDGFLENKENSPR
ncbi:hypothetical protein ACLB2K_004727 [Fragaria x ananassa]